MFFAITVDTIESEKYSRVFFLPKQTIREALHVTQSPDLFVIADYLLKGGDIAKHDYERVKQYYDKNGNKLNS